MASRRRANSVARGGRGGRTQTAGRGGKTAKKSTANSDEAWKCKVCSTEFNDDNDHVVECERCELYVCQTCLKIDDVQYAAFSLPNVHYFCDDCDIAAVTAVKTDADIDAKIKAYSEKVENRLTALEALIATKAEKSVIDEMNTKIRGLENKLVGVSKDVSKTNKRVELVRTEDEKKRKREKNLIIRGVPENDEIQDKDVVENILQCIGCELVIPKVSHIDRLGPIKDQERETVENEENSEGGTRPKPHCRPIRLKLEDIDAKKSVLKNASKIREDKNADVDGFDNKSIFIVPDKTKIERENDLQLRNQLTKKREDFPHDKWKIRHGKIVKVVPIPPQEEE